MERYYFTTRYCKAPQDIRVFIPQSILVEYLKFKGAILQ